ncbi:hypothetical protein GCM10020229_27470 [Kitasatospora albolonga]
MTVEACAQLLSHRVAPAAGGARGAVVRCDGAPRVRTVTTEDQGRDENRPRNQMFARRAESGLGAPGRAGARASGADPGAGQARLRCPGWLAVAVPDSRALPDV